MEEFLTDIVIRIDKASKDNNGPLLAQLEVELATFIMAFPRIKEYVEARQGYSNDIVTQIDSEKKLGGKLSVAEAERRVEGSSQHAQTIILYERLFKSAESVLNALKDQIKVSLSERGIS